MKSLWRLTACFLLASHAHGDWCRLWVKGQNRDFGEALSTIPLPSERLRPLLDSQGYRGTAEEIVESLVWIDQQNLTLFDAMGKKLNQAEYSHSEESVGRSIRRWFSSNRSLSDFEVARQALIEDSRGLMVSEMAHSTNRRLRNHLLKYPAVMPKMRTEKEFMEMLVTRVRARLHVFLRRETNNHANLMADMRLSFDPNLRIRTREPNAVLSRQSMRAATARQSSEQEVFHFFASGYVDPFFEDYRTGILGFYREAWDSKDLIDRHIDYFLDRKEVERTAHRRFITQMMLFVLASDEAAISGTKIRESFRGELTAEGAMLIRKYESENPQTRSTSNSGITAITTLPSNPMNARPSVTRSRGKRQAVAGGTNDKKPGDELADSQLTESQRELLSRRDLLGEINSYANVHFHDLIAICTALWGEPRITDNRRIYQLPWRGEPFVIVTYHRGNEVVPYEVKSVRDAIRKMLTLLD